jgi:hypothetical protein
MIFSLKKPQSKTFFLLSCFFSSLILPLPEAKHQVNLLILFSKLDQFRDKGKNVSIYKIN